MLDVLTRSCSACNRRLYDSVKYCPYCGVATSAVEPQEPSVAVPPSPANNDGALVRKPASDMRVSPAIASKSTGPSAASSVARPALPVPTPKTISPSTTSPVSGPKVTAIEQPALVRGNSGNAAGLWSILAILVIGMGFGLYWFSMPNKKDLACTQSISSATEKLAAGDAASARKEALLAMASCSGEDRIKVSDIQAAADKLGTAQFTCERGNRQLRSMIEERNLQSARAALDKQDAACAGNSQVTVLRQKIVFGQAAAIKAEIGFRKQLGQGDLTGANSMLEQINNENREHPDLVALRRELQVATAARESDLKASEVKQAQPQSNVALGVSPPSQVPPPAKSTAPLQPIAPVTIPTRAPQADLVQSFLNDAETSMGQLKFDAAKTYVESARRIDPSNAQATALLKKIKEREIEYVRKEMIVN